MKKSTKLIVIYIFLLVSNISSGQEPFFSNNLDTLLSKNYTINTSLLNTLSDNLGGHVHKDTLYFASNKKVRSAKQYVNKDGKYFYNLYKAPLNSLYNSNKILLKGSINTDLNESLPVVTKNGNTMYYTGNYTEKGNVHKNLNIFKASKKNGVWGNAEYVSLNSLEYSNGQAVLNDEETKIYFVSNRDPLSNNSNIYEATIGKDGVFSKAQKLGSSVNTSANEMAPFVTKNNELYFSSDREAGFGGFDVFYIDLNDKDAKAVNLGNAINSKEDDFSYSINTKTSKGFVTSNKSGILGIYAVLEKEPIRLIIEKHKKEQFEFNQDQKYQVTLQENKIISSLNLTFLPGKSSLNKEGQAFLKYLISYIRKNPNSIIDINTLIKSNTISKGLLNERISHVIEEINKTTKYAYNFRIEAKGVPRIEAKIASQIEAKKVPQIEAEKVPQIESKIVSRIEAKKVPQIEAEIVPQIEAKIVSRIEAKKVPQTESKIVARIEAKKVPQSEAKIIPSLKSPLINDIAFYFDYNSSYLNAKNKEQLIAIAKKLRVNTALVAVFSTHSDSRGTKAYNVWLSKRRLKRIKEFYIKLGILKHQIMGKSYGEEILLKNCANDAICEEQVHKLNRRVGYKIIKQKAFLKFKD